MRRLDPTLTSAKAWREMMAFYKTLTPGIWLMKLPVVGARLQRHWIQEGSDANWFIPIGEAIPTGQQMILPGEIVERLLREADGIFAMSACPCRSAFKCQNHPWEIGCLHLGPAARRIPENLGRLLTLEEGLAHLEKALSSGLWPTILHLQSDADVFHVPANRLLSICLCCECCCDVRLLLRDGPDRYWDLYNRRMPGVRMVVSSACTRCGDCLAACYGGERVIRLGAERAEIQERCIGCGRCVPVCPEDAISMEIDSQADVMDVLLERIAARTQIGPDL